MSVVVAKYLQWPVSIIYSEHIFNLAEQSADVEQLDVLKRGGFLLLLLSLSLFFFFLIDIIVPFIH